MTARADRGVGASLESLLEYGSSEGLEAPVRLVEQGRCCREIDGCGLNIDMSQESGKCQQPRLRIDTESIPAREDPDSKGMSLIPISELPA